MTGGEAEEEEYPVQVMVTHTQVSYSVVVGFMGGFISICTIVILKIVFLPDMVTCCVGVPSLLRCLLSVGSSFA